MYNQTFHQPGLFMLWFAEYGGVLIQFFIFQKLFQSLDSTSFGQWEWLQIWYGLLLLLPRNGLDIIAIRSANRYPMRLREWTALVLIVRCILGPIAALLLYISGNMLNAAPNEILVKLGFTIVISAITPEIACRASSRFQKYSIVLCLRNVFFLTLISILPELTLNRLAWCFMLTELMICVIWWHDTARHNALPGGRVFTLFRRSANTILVRSAEQSFSRWFRVLSWSADALIIGIVVPELWAAIAPARRLLMSVVIPLSNWLGALAPTWSRFSDFQINRVIQRMSLGLIIMTGCVCLVVQNFGLETLGMLFQKRTLPSIDVLIFMAGRFAPFSVGLLIGCGFTAKRSDLYAIAPALFQTVGQCFAGVISVFLYKASHVAGIICLMECFFAFITWLVWTNPLRKRQSSVSHASRPRKHFLLRSQNLKPELASLAVMEPRS